MRVVIVSMLSRSFRGFNEMNICPLLRCPKPPLPVKAVTVSTAGSCITMATKSCSFFFMAWKEICWSARMKPMMRPVSCCGKKPFGMMT